MAMAWKLQELTYRYVQEHTFEVALLPIGSTEPHGLHMPYGSDALQSEIIAGLVCQRANRQGARALVLPTVPYGVNTSTLAFPLVISVRQGTLNTLLTDIVHSLEAHGIRKLILFNGHGGNEFKPFIRDIYGETTVFITLVNWWEVGLDCAAEIFETVGDHAGEMETSVGLTLFAHLIRFEDADDGSVRPFQIEALRRGWASTVRPWERLTRDSTSGDPRPATREKGERYVELVVERLSQFVVDLSHASLDDPLFPFTNEEVHSD